MIKNWTKLKELIRGNEKAQGVFLSLISRDGQIMCANANMVKTLHLKDPRQEKTNFFDLLHPFNIIEFKTAIHTSTEENSSHVMEVYLKNGQYHPMKWEINCLERVNGEEKNYLCLGHKIIDDERVKKFSKLGKNNYEMILGGLNVGILFQDRKGEIIAVNHKTAEIFNTTQESLYQINNLENLWDNAWQINTESGDAVTFDRTPFMKALSTGELQTAILDVRLENGESRWLHFSSQPLFEGDNSSPYAVVSSIKDVSQKKQLSDQLQESDALFNAFMKHSPNLTWVVDEHAKLVFANQSFFQCFG